MRIFVSELNFDAIAKEPVTKKALLITLMVLLLWSIGYVFFINAKTTRLASLIQTEKQLKETFKETQFTVSALDLYKVGLQKIQKDFVEQLPAENEMPGLLDDITNIGTQAGLTFQLFAPQKEVVQQFYKELPIHLKVLGSYQQIRRFLLQLESMNQLVTVHDFTIQDWPIDAFYRADTLSNETWLTMTLTIKIYWQRSE